MRFARVLLASTAVLFGAAACAGTANASGVWIEVIPATVTAGSQVTIRASCGENSNPATITSNAFGTVTVTPAQTVLVAQVTVPATTAAATFDVRLICPTGSRATTKLTVLTPAATATTATVVTQAAMGPHTGGGFLANRVPGLPADRSGLVWLAGGLTALVSATVLLVRTKPTRRPNPAARSARSERQRAPQSRANEAPRSRPTVQTKAAVRAKRHWTAPGRTTVDAGPARDLAERR